MNFTYKQGKWGFYITSQKWNFPFGTKVLPKKVYLAQKKSIYYLVLSLECSLEKFVFMAVFKYIF